MYIMKLDRMLRKAAPFLLIVILIACLFSKPRKEGMKGHYYEKDHGKNAEIAVLTPMSALGAAVVGGVSYMTYQGAQYEREMKAQSDEEARIAAEETRIADENAAAEEGKARAARDFKSKNIDDDYFNADGPVGHSAEDISSMPESTTGESQLADLPNAIRTDDLTSPKQIPKHYEDMGKQVKDDPLDTGLDTAEFAAKNPAQFETDAAFDGLDDG